ncbi:dockerin type I repeat-containing protein [Fontivita pretiosa]|uniref:dockerin type I repeat-containing protein n=1 Tax=Fontivita pretiosa TaxID=2989684 RepID=UPI003D17B549
MARALAHSGTVVSWVLGFLLTGAHVQGADRYFIGLPSGGTGNWSEPSNWTAATIPQLGDAAWIASDDPFDRAVMLDADASMGTLTIGNTGGGLTTLYQNGEFDLTSSSEVLGYGWIAPAGGPWLANSRASHVQNAGANSVGLLMLGDYNSYQTPASGLYVLNGGTLTADDLTIGNAGYGTFQQNGGMANVVGMYLSYMPNALSSYTLSGGTLAVVAEHVGYAGNGTFLHVAGAHVISGRLSIGTSGASIGQNSGTYILSGSEATLLAYEEWIGRHIPAFFIQSAGTHTVSTRSVLGWGHLATYDLSGGTFTVGGTLELGYAGRGTLNQSGGAVTVGTKSTTGLMTVGVNGWGFYNLLSDAATLSVFGTEIVGYNARGIFDHRAGTHLVSDRMIVGSISIPTNPSRYLLDGGEMRIGNSALIGVFGSGYLAQTGGTFASPFVEIGGEGSITWSGGGFSVATLSLAGRMSLGAGSGRTLVVSALDITGSGRLDLNDNAAIVTTGNEATIAARIKSALENGGAYDWAGPGIGSTFGAMQNAAAGSYLYGLGVLRNNDGAGNPIHTSFAGQPLSSNEVLVKFTCFGDADLSGSIDATDYSLIDNGYVNSLTGWINGDFDYSGTIDATDYALIDNAYVNQAGPLAEALIAQHSQQFGGEYLAALRAIQSGVIPEPASLGACITGLLAGSSALRRGARPVRRRIGQP